MIGTTVGHYRILSLLGRGAMGEVYLARDERLRRNVALKVLPLALAGDRERRHHLEREARALGALNHPGIVGVHGIEEEGDLLLLAMEVVDGTPLNALIPPEGMDFCEVVRIASSLAEAVGAAHRGGVVHRDLKPANVVVTPEGGVKVLDFGLAKIHAAAGATAVSDSSSSATTPGTIIGTAHYMSPEQAQGLPVDARSDIFSLGVVLFHMVTGRRPFEGATPVAILSSIIKDVPPLVTQIRPDLPPAFARLVARCLEKDPVRRVQDAADLAAALRDIGIDRGGKPTTGSARRFLRVWTAVALRHRWATAAILLAAIAATAAWWWNRSRAPAVLLNPGRVAVAPFDNHTGEPAFDAVGLMVADRIGEGLVEQLALQVVPGSAVLDAWPEASAMKSQSVKPDRVRVLAERLGAGVVVSGDYYSVGGDLVFRGRMTDVVGGREIGQFGPVTGPRDSPGRAVESVRQYVLGEAAIHFKGVGGVATAGIPPEVASNAPPMPYEAYRELRAGLDAFGRDPRASIAHLERVEALYPHRALVLPWLVLGFMRLGELEKAEDYVATVSQRVAPEDLPLLDYFKARLDGRWTDAYASIRAFRQSMPRHLPTVNTAAGAAIALGRPREAAALLASVDVGPWLDSSSGRAWLSNRADVAHLAGKYEEEREYATRLAAAAPEAAAPLLRSLAALRRSADIPFAIERAHQGTRPGSLLPRGALFRQAAEELGAHGDPAASRDLAERGLHWMTALDPAAAGAPPMRRLRAELLSLLGRWRESADVFAHLASEHPDDIAALSGLGVASARLGRTQVATRASGQLSRLGGRYRFGAHTYAQARIAAASRQRDRAVLLLEQAFAEGCLIIWLAHADPAFEGLRGHGPFDRLTAMDQERGAGTHP